LRDLGTKPLVPLPAYPAAGLARTLVDETPWRLVLLSILLTCLSLTLLLVLERSRPEPLERPEPEPVKVTVILPQEVPQTPQPAVVQAPEPVRNQPPPPIQKPVIQEPVIQKPVIQEPVIQEPVIQEPPRVVRKTPVLQPKTALARQTPLVETPLPQPSKISPRLSEPLTEAPSAMPNRKAEMPVQQEASLSVEPTLNSYNQPSRPVATAAVPSQRASFNTDVAVNELVAQPTPRRVAERSPAKASLPSKATVAISRPNATELNAVETGLSDVQYETVRPAPSLPASARMATVATSRGVEAAIASPQASGVRTDIGERVSDAPVPASARASVAFSGASSEESLIGPAATVINTTTQKATALPIGGGSFDFLDSMASSDLDRSLMVSLNRLRTCRDPGEEKKLKTSLASLLSQPAMCRSGGVVFDIRNPESAYSIHINFYNYEQKEFQDRCDALRLAVQSCEARR
jgi:hypothetical protein